MWKWQNKVNTNISVVFAFWTICTFTDNACLDYHVLSFNCIHLRVIWWIQSSSYNILRLPVIFSYIFNFYFTFTHWLLLQAGIIENLHTQLALQGRVWDKSALCVCMAKTGGIDAPSIWSNPPLSTSSVSICNHSSNSTLPDVANTRESLHLLFSSNVSSNVWLAPRLGYVPVKI